MKDYLEKLNDDEPSVRIEALNYISSNIDNLDKNIVVKNLKEHILDWDEDVRANVCKVLKLYMGQ